MKSKKILLIIICITIISGGLFIYAFNNQDSDTAEEIIKQDDSSSTGEEPSITFVIENDLDTLDDNLSESSSVTTSDFSFNGSWISTYYGVESGMQYTYPLPETMLEISDEHFRIITGMDGVTAIFEGLLSKSSTYELLATVTSPLVHDELELTIRENFILIYQPETMHIRAISLYQTNEGFSDVDYFFSRWD